MAWKRAARFAQRRMSPSLCLRCAMPSPTRSKRSMPARIRAALRRSPQLAGEMQIVRFEDVEINFNLRRVVVQNRETRLTPKEFELLQYFLAHPNVPISHTKLLQ